MLQSRAHKVFGLLAGLILVLILMGFSVVYGLTEISWSMAYEALFHFDGSNEHIIVQQNRLPRALIATAVGASLAVAGLLMQGLTRNPLASPAIFGVNAGASFAIVLAISVWSVTSLSSFIWIAFLGAAVVSTLVYLLSAAGQGGMNPIKLTLAGAAMGALCMALTQGLLVLNERALEEALFWLAGSVQGRKLEWLFAALPYLLAGIIGAFLIAKPMNVLALGDEVAKGLGQKNYADQRSGRRSGGDAGGRCRLCGRSHWVYWIGDSPFCPLAGRDRSPLADSVLCLVGSHASSGG